jgi:hypothetical protein
MRIHTTHTRDAALQQLHRMNRWLLAGSVLLTGAFTEAAAHAFPGRTVKKAAAAGARTKARAHRGGASRRSSTSIGSVAPLKQPAQAPQVLETSSSPSAAQAQEAAPNQEAQATQEPAPEREASATQEAPSSEASSPPAEAPHESAPEPQPEPEPEPEPVVSGGS